MHTRTPLEVLRECTQIGLLAHLDDTARRTLEQYVRRMPPETLRIPLEVLAAAPDTIVPCAAVPLAEGLAVLERLVALAHGRFPATACIVDIAAEGEICVSFALCGRRYQHVLSFDPPRADISIRMLSPVVDLANQALRDAGCDGRFEWLFFHEDKWAEAGPYWPEALIFLTYEQHGQVVLRDLVRLAEHYRYPMTYPRTFDDTLRELQALGLLHPLDSARLDEVQAEWEICEEHGNEKSLSFLLSSLLHSTCEFDVEMLYDPAKDYRWLIEQLSAVSRGGFAPQELRVVEPPAEERGDEWGIMISFRLGEADFHFELDCPNEHVNWELFYTLNRIMREQHIPGQFYDVPNDSQCPIIIYLTHEQHAAVVERALIPLGDD